MPVGGGTHLGSAVGSIRIDTSGVVAAEKQVGSASRAMDKSLSAIGLAAGLAGVQQLGQLGFSLAEDAAIANRTRVSFEALAQGVGESAASMLAALRTASQGMIADNDLVLAANRAMLLGVADSGAEMAQLLDVARVRGEAMGIGVTQAFNDLVLGLGRVSPEILDNLGIVTGGIHAYDDYAASVGKSVEELSQAEKRQVLLNKAVAESQTLIDASAGAGDSAANDFARWSASLANTKQELGEMLLAAGATDTLETFISAVEESKQALQDIGKWLEATGQKYIDFYADINDVPGVSAVVAYFDRVKEAARQYQDVLAQIGAFAGFREAPGVPQFTEAPAAWMTSAYSPSSSLTPAGASPAPGVDNAKLLSAQRDYATELGDINRDSAESIQDATAQYGRQRAETIRSYEEGIVRDAADFAQQRARSQRDYERDVADIVADAAKREAAAQADLDERIGDARQESNERVAELEEDFAQARERAQRQHGDRLLDAAGRLDAQAIYEEQRNFAQQEKDAQDAHDEQLDEERESLDKQIAQAQEAHDEQLADARQADATRLEDMRASRAQQQADEDEDRRIAQERAAADHERTLAQQATDHALSIQQLTENAAEQRTALQASLDAQLADLGLHNLAYEKEQRRLQEAALLALKPYMENWFATAREAMLASLVGLPVQGPLPAATFPSLDNPLAGLRTGNTTTINMAPGTITINESVTPQATGEEVRRQLLTILQEAE